LFFSFLCATIEIMDFLQDYDEEEEVIENNLENEQTAPAEVAERPVVAGDSDSDDDFGPVPLPFELNEDVKDIKSKKKKKTKESKKAIGPQSPTAGDNEDLAKLKKIPISSEVHLVGHEKACTCISIEPAGNRLVTGSLDYLLKIYDFGGMDSRCRAFQSSEPAEGHPIVAISHSPSGDRYVISTGSSQPIVMDRDGKELIKFVKGDMYLRDMSNTKGHTMEVTHVCWHPSEKNIILTSSLDGTLRIWDLLGEATFGCLINKHVLKIKAGPSSNTAGAARIGATTCLYSPNAQRIIGGTLDGSVQIWTEKRIYSSKADLIISWRDLSESARSSSSSPSPVISITVTNDNTRLAVRYECGLILLWSFTDNCKNPLFQWKDCPNIYPSANLLFNLDSSLLLFCTSPRSGGPDPHSRIHFYDVSSSSSNKNSHSTTTITTPKEILSLVISNNLIGIHLKWHPVTNQIFITLSNGEIKVLYDPELSKKGILLSVHKAPKREKDPNDYSIVGEIYTPFALNMYKEETEDDKYLKRVMELKDPIKAKIPQKPTSQQGPGSRPNTSFFFTQYMVSTEGKQKDIRTEDPREALLKMNSKAEENPMFFGKAYEKSQPKRLLTTTTFEEEQEEFKKKQKI
jgi:WD40 repeat protein